MFIDKTPPIDITVSWVNPVPRDYTKYPDSIAPRRFEVWNSPDHPNHGVYAHGVEYYDGIVIITGPTQPIIIYGSIKEVKSEFPIKWIDPPFEREEETDE